MSLSISNITSWIAKLSSTVKVIIIASIAFVTLFFVNRYNYHRYQEQKQETERLAVNIKALVDTVHVYKLRDGSTNYQKLAFNNTSVNDIKQYDTALYNDAKQIKGTIKYIQQDHYIYNTDTVKLVVYSNKLADSTIETISRLDTTYSEGNFHHLAVTTNYNPSTGIAYGSITKEQIGFTAVTGIVKTSRGYEIFVNPKLPGLTLEKLEGSIIGSDIFPNTNKSKQPLITVGASLGYVPLTYEINNKKLDLNLTRVGAGISINFNLFR